MTKRFFLLLLLILVMPIGGYLWYRQTPEQQIGRTIDQFLENVEHRKISIRSQDDVHKALAEVLAPKINLQGKFPIPTEEMTMEEIFEKIDLFHGMTSLCEMTEIERSIQIVGSKAQVYHSTDILVAAGKNNQDEQTWDLIIDLEKKEDWRITGIRGSKQ